MNKVYPNFYHNEPCFVNFIPIIRVTDQKMRKELAACASTHEDDRLVEVLGCGSSYVMG